MPWLVIQHPLPKTMKGVTWAEQDLSTYGFVTMQGGDRLFVVASALFWLWGVCLLIS